MRYRSKWQRGLWSNNFARFNLFVKCIFSPLLLVNSFSFPLKWWGYSSAGNFKRAALPRYFSSHQLNVEIWLAELESLLLVKENKKLHLPAWIDSRMKRCFISLLLPSLLYYLSEVTESFGGHRLSRAFVHKQTTFTRSLRNPGSVQTGDLSISVKIKKKRYGNWWYCYAK